MQGSKGADFDVVAFDTSAFERYIDGGLIQPLDEAKLPNLADLAAAFKDVPAVMRDGKRYGAPFAWGSLPLVYDADQVATPDPLANREPDARTVYPDQPRAGLDAGGEHRGDR